MEFFEVNRRADTLDSRATSRYLLHSKNPAPVYICLNSCPASPYDKSCPPPPPPPAQACSDPLRERQREVEMSEVCRR
ncbi:hypothetical protein NQZ68_023735 [Dissostichus eleginoides]|nr:hypothetical protein NQZ68_023735 [Dissostichus eleginoides]